MKPYAMARLIVTRSEVEDILTLDGCIAAAQLWGLTDAELDEIRKALDILK